MFMKFIGANNLADFVTVAAFFNPTHPKASRLKYNFGSKIKKKICIPGYVVIIINPINNIRTNMMFFVTGKDFNLVPVSRITIIRRCFFSCICTFPCRFGPLVTHFFLHSLTYPLKYSSGTSANYELLQEKHKCRKVR